MNFQKSKSSDGFASNKNRERLTRFAFALHCSIGLAFKFGNPAAQPLPRPALITSNGRTHLRKQPDRP
jgi:hypothetical protein